MNVSVKIVSIDCASKLTMRVAIQALNQVLGHIYHRMTSLKAITVMSFVTEHDETEPYSEHESADARITLELGKKADRPEGKQLSYLDDCETSYSMVRTRSDIGDAINNYPNPLAPGAYIDFRRLNNVREILEALEQTQDFLQIRQIVSAFARFRSGGMAVSRRILDSLIDLAERTIGSTRVEDVVGMLLSCARFRVIERRSFLNDLARLAIERSYIKEMSIREIATVIHSCVVLIRAAEKGSGNRTQRFAKKRQRQPIPPSGFEDHGEIESGLGDVEELLSVAIDEITSFREPDEEFELRLPSILRSLSFFGGKDPRLDAVVERIAVNISRFRDVSEDRIAAIIFAMANSNSVDRDIIGCLAVEVTRPDRLAVYSTTQLMGILQAFAELKVDAKGIWIALFAECTQPIRLQELTHQQLPILLRAVVNTSLCRDVERAALIAAHAFSDERLEELSVTDCIKLVEILATMTDQIYVDGSRLIKKIATKRDVEKAKDAVGKKFLLGLSKLRFTQYPQIWKLLNCVQQRQASGIITYDDLRLTICTGREY